MDEFTAQVLGKLTLLEFLLEIQYANAFADMPQEAFDGFGRDLVYRLRYRSSASSGTEAEDAIAVQAAAVNFAERFLRNIERRMEDIRRSK